MLAIIGGSGLDSLEGITDKQEHKINTAYGSHSSPLESGRYNGAEIVFLPRHGGGHKLAPHKINYRANLAALSRLGVKHIVAVNAVGSISPSMPPGSMVIPDQVIDYTYGREHTRYDDGINLDHIDFTVPFCPDISTKLLLAFRRQKLPVINGGVYGCTQGPRLETAAEVERMRRDGCDLIGMTLMPEASLAREFGIDYASVCLVANWCAGVSSDEALSIDAIMETIHNNVNQLKKGLSEFLKQ